MQPSVHHQPGWGAHREYLKGKSGAQPAPTTYQESYYDQKAQRTEATSDALNAEPLMQRLLARDRIPLPHRTGSFETDSFRRSFSLAELRNARGSAVHASSRDRYQDMSWVRHFPKLRESLRQCAERQVGRTMERHVARPLPSRTTGAFIVGPPGSHGITYSAFASNQESQHEVRSQSTARSYTKLKTQEIEDLLSICKKSHTIKRR
eukprot:gnl/MRDRNA2_/MRDRNA2_113467_c0_seq1.p1 gnl/MRDRNA2_/MRDRNA2_113467_c0~~gnl/MRDRNA2_/MRDRNA2_113467_c0_seq1.p1  ORF type:complete len:207 (-),score=22.18 gnl/MRDRNA2_/MRDRNA2_113467_c0_seq1:103-723(-)